MKTRRNRFVAVLAAATMTFGSLAFASAEEPVLEPATDTLYISAGCPPATPAGGTCTSVRWLGKNKGSATSGYTTSITPVDEVLYHLEGALNWRDYASDETFPLEGYTLRAGEPIVQTVTVAATGAGVMTTVYGRIESYAKSGEDVYFEPQSETVTIPPGQRATVKFEFTVPEELDGLVLDAMTAFVAVRGVNAYAGHIDQQGGSTVTIPHWVPAETEPAAAP